MDHRKKLIRELAYLMAEGSYIIREMKAYGPWDQYGDEDIPMFVVINTDDYEPIPQDLFDQSQSNDKAKEAVIAKLRISCKNHRAFMDAYNEASQMSMSIETGVTA